MPADSPTRSRFRPATLPDQAVLSDHGPLLRSLERRGLIRGGLSLGALTMLTGCDVSQSGSVEKALLAISAFNDRVQSWLFDPDHLAPTYPRSAVLKPPRFNAYYEIEDLKPVDGATWKLEVGGLVTDKRPWTQDMLAALPHTDMVWNSVENWL